MTTFAVLGTGPSMNQAVADSVRHLRRIAVSDAYELAPDAEAMVAIDVGWWRAHPEAKSFAGRKFCVSNFPQSGIERLIPDGLVHTGWNSGLLGMHVAIAKFGATRVELYGFDMTAERGAHYFGEHGGDLANTKPARFETFKRQFAAYPVPSGVKVVNCTPGSALKEYPFCVPDLVDTSS